MFAERRTLVMMALGFAAGLPYLLIFDTLSAWLRQVGLSLQVIGFFSLATLVSSFKFLWAPLVDLGERRRLWYVATALLTGLWLAALALLLLALARPAKTATEADTEADGASSPDVFAGLSLHEIGRAHV